MPRIPKIILLIALLFLLLQPAHAQRGDFWNVDFARADSIALRYDGYSLKKMDELVDSLTLPLDAEVEKFRAIFRWITLNVSYDYPMFLDIQRQDAKKSRNRNTRSKLVERMSRKRMRNLILKRKAVCSGYASLLEYMSDRAGLECAFVSGHARTYGLSYGRPNHAWNAVKLNNKWYLCDVTWASGWVDPAVGRFFKQYEDAYFLTDPSLFISNHYPEDKRWTLLRDAPSLKDFLAAPFRPTGFIKNKINTYSPEKMLVRVKLKERLEVRFTSNLDTIELESNVLISKKGKTEYTEIVVTSTRENTGAYLLEIPFTEKGNFVMWVSINNLETLVYDVVVN